MVDRLQRVLGEGPLVPGGEPLEDLPLPRRRMKIEFLRLFDVADLDHDLGALVQQVDQFVIDLVDLFAQFLNFLIWHSVIDPV